MERRELAHWRQYSFSCVCPVIIHEIRHNIVKIAVDPQGDNRYDISNTRVVNNYIIRREI